MIQLAPYQQNPYHHDISKPRISNITQIDVAQTYFDDGQVTYEMKQIQETKI